MPDVGMVDGMDGRRSGPSAQRTRGSHGSPRGIPPAMSLPYGDPYGVPSRFFELFGTLLFIAGTLSFHYFILSPIQYGCHPQEGFGPLVALRSLFLVSVSPPFSIFEINCLTI